MDDLDAAIKKAELDRLQSETRRIDSETEKINYEREELSSRINSKWWHVSGTSLIQALLGGAVAGFLVAGFALDHFINVTDLNEKNEEALKQKAQELEKNQMLLEEDQKSLQLQIKNLEDESEQLQAQLNNRVTAPEQSMTTDYVTDVWAYGVSGGDVDKARDYLKDQGYSVGSGGLLPERPNWLAASPAVFYYHESSKNVAEKIAAGLRGETGFVYEVRRGAGYGVASNARDITFFIHIVPTN